MTKILFVIPSLTMGGAELFLLRLCKHISFEYEVYVLVLGNRQGLFEEYEKLPIKVYYLGFSKVYHFPKALVDMRRLFKSIKPSIIQTFLYYSDILAAISNFGLRHKLVWTIRGTSLANGTKKYKIATQRVAAYLSRRSPDLIIACGFQASKFHRNLGYPEDKIIVIGNFSPDSVNLARNYSIFKKIDCPLKFSIGLAARYDIGKGHRSLVLCVIDFLESHPEIEEISLNFAGKGCEKNGRLESELILSGLIQEKVEQGRLRIVFSGRLTEEEMVFWYQSVDLYFMSSDSLEGFPNSLAEALSIGIPSLSTPIGEAVYFLPRAYLCGSAAVEEMSGALSRFYLRKAVEIGNDFDEIKSQMDFQFSSEHIVKEYKEAWDGLVLYDH